jgi:hypothetical protein
LYPTDVLVFGKEAKNRFSTFLSFFIITPTKSSLKDQILFITSKAAALGSSVYIRTSTFLFNVWHKVKLPKYLLWRPLFKKSSYYGLYVNARASFIKIFRKD